MKDFERKRGKIAAAYLRGKISREQYIKEVGDLNRRRSPRKQRALKQ